MCKKKRSIQKMKHLRRVRQKEQGLEQTIMKHVPNFPPSSAHTYFGGRNQGIMKFTLASSSRNPKLFTRDMLVLCLARKPSCVVVRIPWSTLSLVGQQWDELYWRPIGNFAFLPCLSKDDGDEWHCFVRLDHRTS